MESSSVLIVDDDIAIIESLSDVFEAYFDYEVEFCQDPIEGLDTFFEGNFDLVLSDVNMPGINGIEFATKVREKKYMTPILIMTGLVQKEDILASMQLGVFDFIEKPVTIEKLEHAIKAGINFSQMLKKMTHQDHLNFANFDFKKSPEIMELFDLESLKVKSEVV